MYIFMMCLGLLGSIIIAIFRYRKPADLKSLLYVCIGCILMAICLAYLGATNKI